MFKTVEKLQLSRIQANDCSKKKKNFGPGEKKNEKKQRCRIEEEGRVKRKGGRKNRKMTSHSKDSDCTRGVKKDTQICILEPKNMERYTKNRAKGESEQKKKKTGSLDNFQGHYSHHGQTWNEGSISHTLTHHYNSSYGSQCECVCIWECVYSPLDHCSFQRNRLSLDLSLSSLL